MPDKYTLGALMIKPQYECYRVYRGSDGIPRQQRTCNKRFWLVEVEV